MVAMSIKLVVDAWRGGYKILGAYLVSISEFPNSA